MNKTDAENAALMDHLERTIPPANPEATEQLLREAKRIFDERGVVFFTSARNVSGCCERWRVDPAGR